MALLFIDGFDAGDTSLKWRSGGTITSTAGGPFGTGRYASVSGLFYHDMAVAKSKIFCGFAASCSSISASGGGIVLYLIGDNRTVTHLTLWIKQDEVRLVRGAFGGTTIASAAGSFMQNTFYYIEVSATIADAGGTCEVRLNGVTVINYTGDTKNAGTNNSIDCIGFSSNSNSIGVDDFWIADDTGPAPHNTFLGNVRIQTLVPSGAGNSTQFTPSTGANYSTVDELPYSSTDYVSSQTAGQKDTYAMTDIAASPQNIFATQTNLIARKTDAGSIGVRPILRSGGTDYAGSSTYLGVGDVVIRELHPLNPATSTAWTASSVNAIETGMEVV